MGLGSSKLALPSPPCIGGENDRDSDSGLCIPRQDPPELSRGYTIAKKAADEMQHRIYCGPGADCTGKKIFVDWRTELQTGKNYFQAPGLETKVDFWAGPKDPLKSDSLGDEYGECDPVFLQSRYIQFRDALNHAQGQSMRIAPSRWLELQRAQDLTQFLMRGDVSVITKEELSHMGEAIRHTDIALDGVRKNWMRPYSEAREALIPGQLEGSLQIANKMAKKLAAQGYRCRANEFLPPLEPQPPKKKRPEDDCTIL